MTLSPMASRVATARGRCPGTVVDASGSISKAVSNNAGSPELSINVLDNSMRVTSPCAPTSSTS